MLMIQMVRKFFVGGNWKMNGSVAMVKTLVDMLNGATIPPNTGKMVFII